MPNDTEALELPAVAWRIRYHSEPGTMGYPWQYVERASTRGRPHYDVEALCQLDFAHAAVAKVAAELVQMRDDRDSWLEQCSSRLADAVQFAAERDAWQAECKLVEHKLLTCGVAATHPDPELSSRQKDYGGKWDSPQAEDVRKLRAERDQLRAELEALRQAALTAHNSIDADGRSEPEQAALLAALQQTAATVVAARDAYGWSTDTDRAIDLLRGIAPALKPLSDAQAEAILNSDARWLDLVRAVERAHGIGIQPEGGAV